MRAIRMSHPVGAGVLGGVGQRLGGHEVGRALHRRRRALRDVDRQRHVHRRGVGQRGERRLQTAVGQHRRMDAAGQVAQLAQRLLGAGAGLGEQLAGPLGIVGELLLGHAQAHAQRHQPSLGAVVEVALDPAKLAVLDVDGTGPARLQRLDPLGHLSAVRRRRARTAIDCAPTTMAQPDQRPDRPEVAMAGDRPDGDREQPTARRPRRPCQPARGCRRSAGPVPGARRAPRTSRGSRARRPAAARPRSARSSPARSRAQITTVTETTNASIAACTSSDLAVGARGVRGATADARPAAVDAPRCRSRATRRTSRARQPAGPEQTRRPADAEQAAASGYRPAGVTGASTTPSGTSSSDCRNVCGCQKPSCAPPWTNGTQNGATIIPSAAPSRPIRTAATGNPTNQRSHRNA